METKLTPQETRDAIGSLKRYFDAELDTALSDLRATLLLDFILKEFGPYAYNRGVKDAENHLRSRLDDLPGFCFEQPLTHWQAKKKR